MQLNLIASTNLSSIVSKSQVSFGGIDNLENNKNWITRCSFIGLLCKCLGLTIFIKENARIIIVTIKILPTEVVTSVLLQKDNKLVFELPFMWLIEKVYKTYVLNFEISCVTFSRTSISLFNF